MLRNYLLVAGAPPPQPTAPLSLTSQASPSGPRWYWGLSAYLLTFAYCMDLGVAPFAWTYVALFGLVFLTMSYHTLQAARTDPARTLWDE